METEDWYIIYRCLGGDSAAFGLLVDKYSGSVYALAYSMLHNSHDAEDVKQEVFIKAYEKLYTLKKWDSFSKWLYATTSNLCKNWVRSLSRRPDQDSVAEHIRDLKTHSMDSYRVKLLCESLYQTLDSLPEMHRQVLALHYLGGMSVKEIARLSGTFPNTIKQRLRRARSTLKTEMFAAMDAVYRGGDLRDDIFHSNMRLYDDGAMKTTSTLSMLLATVPVLAGTWRYGPENGDWIGWEATTTEPWKDNVEDRLSIVDGVFSMDAMNMDVMNKEEQGLVLYIKGNWENYSLFADMRIVEVEPEAR